MDCIHAAEDIVKLVRRGSTITLGFDRMRRNQIIWRIPSAGAQNTRREGKICDFPQGEPCTVADIPPKIFLLLLGSSYRNILSYSLTY